MPFIRPRKNAEAGHPALERQPDLPGEGGRLLVFPVAAGIKPGLAQDQRPIAGQRLQPGEVGLEFFRRLEEHVEAEEIDERELQVFRGGVVDVGDQRAGIFSFGGVIKSFNEMFDAPVAVPAHDVGGDFVANGKAQQGGMAGALANPLANSLHHLVRQRSVIQKSDVLFPRQADQHPEPVLAGAIEQPARRNRVRAQRVDAGGGHLLEIPGDRCDIVVFAAIRFGAEGAVGDAAH